MCVLPFLVPHHREPLATFFNELMAVGLGIFAAAILMRRSAWLSFRLPVIIIVPAGLIVVLALQIANGMAVYWQQHMLVALYLGWALLLMIVGAELRREFGSEKVVPVMAWALLIGGLLSVAIVAMQMAGFNHSFLIFPRQGGYGANIAQVNQLADYLGLALGSLVYLAASKRLRMPMAALLAILLLFALVLTGARMGWIYVIMLSVGGWLAGRSRSSAAWRALWLIPAFAALQVLVPYLPIGGVPMMPAQKIIAGMQGPSIRMQFIREAWQIFLSHPWLGAGWGQFGWQDFLMASQFPDHAGWTHNAHNIVLQLLAECGIPGAIILLAGMSFWIKQAAARPFSAERWWVLALLGVLAVHSLLEYPLWYAYFLGPAAFLLGFGSEKSPQFRLQFGPVVGFAVVGFGVFNLGYIGWHYNKVENWYQAGLSGRMGGREIVAMLNEMTAMRNKSLITPQIDMVLVRALPEQPPYLSAKLANNTQVMRYRPGDQEVYTQALLQALAGQKGEAAQQLKRSMIRYPEGRKAFLMRITPRLMSGDLSMMPLVEAMATGRRADGVPIISIPGFRPQ